MMWFLPHKVADGLARMNRTVDALSVFLRAVIMPEK
jgi:hypothetical protein